MTKTLARDIMTPNPRIVKVDDSVDRIARVLADENIGAVVVCNDERRLQGMITDRDLAIEVVAKDRDPHSTRAAELVDGREVVTIGADDSIDEAIDTMKAHAVRRLPVIDGTEVIGIVSQADIARVAKDKQVGRLVETISDAPDNTGRG
ncbi:MAG TPA: CBS domain-containing protein [Acidimicrobiales bacterium]|nr:CBS domain-containing protein [Acidimicrobiales bacterium]